MININQKIFCKINFLLLMVVLFLCTNGILYSQSNLSEPFFNVKDVIKEVDKIGQLNLWPGFEPQKIPTAIYDGKNTYLFNHPSPPEGFELSAINSEVIYYKGQYSQVRGNSRVLINNVWTATSVLSNKSKRTGEEYNLRDLAGIIVHEQFHVFQKLNYPNWRPNDGLLMIYPYDTVESLFLRMLEKEAFKRAITTENIADAASWIKQALQYRDKRYSLLDSAFIYYEMELQRFEGISDYIEIKARNNNALSSMSITQGIAPSGIRDLGYIGGRWTALLLDRFDPEWKMKMDQRNTIYMNELIKSAVNNYSSQLSFAVDELKHYRMESENDLKLWEKDNEILQNSFSKAEGIYVEINAGSLPLQIRMFEPLEMENLGNGKMFHKVFFAAGNQKGSLRVLNNQSISFMNNSNQLLRVTVAGLSAEIFHDDKAKKIQFKSQDTSIDFYYTNIKIDGNKYTIEL